MVIAGYGKGRVMDVVVSVEEIVFIRMKEHGCHGFDGYARIWVSDSNLYPFDPLIHVPKSLACLGERAD